MVAFSKAFANVNHGFGRSSFLHPLTGEKDRTKLPERLGRSWSGQIGWAQMREATTSHFRKRGERTEEDGGESEGQALPTGLNPNLQNSPNAHLPQIFEETCTWGSPAGPRGHKTKTLKRTAWNPTARGRRGQGQ